MLNTEGATVVRVSASTVEQPSTREMISTSPESSVASLAALRGKRLRKYSETDASAERLSGSTRPESASSQIYTKVPLTPLAIEDNGDYNFRRQASIRIKKMSSCHDGSSRFPKLNDCAHFHYDHVDLGEVQISMHEETEDRPISLEFSGGVQDLLECPFTVRLLSQGKSWLVKRCYEDFRVLDKQVHKCIYDRRFSQLVELPKGETLTGNREAVRSMLTHYVTRFSQIAGDMINCGPVLNWLELDNHGNHVVASEESAINIPAVAAAHVIKRYTAQAPDEISLEVGDMISVIDMPPSEDSSWWRGKNKFDVGFFPQQCVEIISEKLPPSVADRIPKGPKSVLRKHGKLITFLRSFILERPTRRRLKQRGILKERVFGCDLGEHLLNTGTDVPQVIKHCTQFIEQHGICDGIYRLSGVASNVQYLRDQFDSENTPLLDEYKKDIHCVSAVCKLYFRELPNPLLTYQLYSKFEDAAMSDEEDRLVKMHDTVQQLPPPHYRSLEFLIRHLSLMSSFHHETNMNIKNLAIVWAPNLLRSKDIETGSCALFMEIKVQATVVEYLVKHCDIIFNNRLFPDVPGIIHDLQQRPKSMVISTPTKLLSLEEARARSCSQGNESTDKDDKPKFIEVGGGPSALPKQYHTVIDLPPESRKRLSSSKSSKKSPGWRAFFSRSTAKDGKRRVSHDSASLRGPPSTRHFNNRAHRASLRSVKSAESLSSAESATELKKAEKFLTHTPGHKGHLRRSSVACMENTLRRASSDSFFEVDDDIVSALNREMLEEAQEEEECLDHDAGIFIEAESGARCELGNRRDYGGRNSPLWIDQSVSSMESDSASVKSPFSLQHPHQQEVLSAKSSVDSGWRVHGSDDPMSFGLDHHHHHHHHLQEHHQHHYQEETPPPSPTDMTLSAEIDPYQCAIPEAIPVPPRRRIRASLSMPLATAYTPEYRDVEMMTERGMRGSLTPDQPRSGRGKMSRPMSIRTKNKLTRESSTETDEYGSLGQSPDTGLVDDVLESGTPIMVTVRTQTSPHDTSDDMDTGEEVEKYDVNLQTSGSDTAAFLRTPAQRRSLNLDLFSGLDEAILGTTAPRPKSIHVSSHIPLRGSESYDEDFSAISTRLSLDAVLSEYDHIMAKYNNRPLTPDFDVNDETCKFDGLFSTAGRRLSGPRHHMSPVNALNSNCNNTRQRRLLNRRSTGDEIKFVPADAPKTSTAITDKESTQKRLSAEAVLERQAQPGYVAPQREEEVVVVRLRRPGQLGQQTRLYASPENFSPTSPDIQTSFADHQNGNSLLRSPNSSQKSPEKINPPIAVSPTDMVYRVTLPTRSPNGAEKLPSPKKTNVVLSEENIARSWDKNSSNSGTSPRSDVECRVADCTGGEELPDDDGQVEESANTKLSSPQDASIDVQAIGFQSCDRYPVIISDELEL